MSKLKYICNYSKNACYRQSFSQLASDTFSLDFESWYQHGFWDKNYICYSYIDGNQVIANVSIYKMDFMINGSRKEGAQLVTVMTSPAYRNKGLIANLVKELLHHYEKRVDFIYVAVANTAMMPYWQKLGFIIRNEKQFYLDRDSCETHKKGNRLQIQKLDMLKPDDRQLLFSLAGRRLPTSRYFSLENTQYTVMFYCLNDFRDNIYFFPEQDAVAIYKQEAGILHVYDLLFSKDRCLSSIINTIFGENTREILFHFTPEFDDIHVRCRSYEPENIFITRPAIEITGDFAYPILG